MGQPLAVQIEKNPLREGVLSMNFSRLILYKIAPLSRLFKISGRPRGEKRGLPQYVLECLILQNLGLTYRIASVRKTSDHSSGFT